MGPAVLPADASRVQAAYAAIPLIFEPNQGQTDPGVQFISRNKGFTLFLTADGAVLSIPGPRPEPRGHGRKAPAPNASAAAPPKSLRLRWIGAQGGLYGSGLEALPGHANYFRGRDPRAWVTDVPQYGRVLLGAVYPGIDLTYYDGGRRDLEFDWLIQPGADPAQIAFDLEGAAGLSVDSDGALRADLGGGQRFLLKAPVAYQDQGGRVPVEASYRLDQGGRVSLALGTYDRSLPLVVDPVLDYSSYLGGSLGDSGLGIAVDAAGNAYVTGYTASTDFPLVGSLQSQISWQGAFVTKVNAAGTALVYSTYLGGTYSASVSTAYAIALDGSQDAYIAGSTGAADFPLKNALQSNCPSCSVTVGNAFVAELNPSGNSLVFSTYLGGSGTVWNGIGQGDTAAGIAVDASGAAVVVGSTSSTDFPTLNPLQAACLGCIGTFSGTYNAFVAKFAPGGASLDYSTFLGLGPQTSAYCVALDGGGNAYVGGTGPVPLNHPFDTTDQGFVAKLDAAGDTLVYSTQCCGTGVVAGIAVDAAGAAYVTGISDAGLALVNAIATGPTHWGAFIGKLNPSGSALIYSTYFGGAWTDGFGAEGTGIAVDSGGDAYVVGRTSSPSLALANAWQSTCPSCAACPSCGGNWQGEAFVAELDPSGGHLVYSSYLGGSGTIYTFSDGSRSIYGDKGNAIALDPAGNAYVTGQTYSTDFPAVHPLQGSDGGAPDAFVAKVSALRPTPTASPTAGCAGEVNWLAGLTSTGSTPQFSDGDLSTPFGFFNAGARFGFDLGQARTFHRMVLYSTAPNTLTVAAATVFTGPYTAVPGQSATTTLLGSVYEIVVTFPAVTSRFAGFYIGVGSGAPTEVQYFGCAAPTATPSPSPSPTAGPTRTATPSLTPATPSPSPTATQTLTPRPTRTPSDDSFGLLAVFPNPFGDNGTNIAVEIGYQADLKMAVYTVRGELAYSVTWHDQGPGRLQKAWNGRNSSGTPIANGAYYMTLEAAGEGHDHSASQWISVWR